MVTGSDDAGSIVSIDVRPSNSPTVGQGIADRVRPRIFGKLADEGCSKDMALVFLHPAINFWSRKHEYEADAFAREAVNSWQPMVSSLRKLHEKNLSNLTPHPAYSAFYYSHPTLLEREAAIASTGSG